MSRCYILPLFLFGFLVSGWMPIRAQDRNFSWDEPVSTSGEAWVPECAEPEQLQCTFTGADSLGFGWSLGVGTQRFQVVFGAASQKLFEQFLSPRTITNPSIGFGRLKSDEEYDLYVRRNCDVVVNGITLEEPIYSDWVHIRVKTKKRNAIHCGNLPVTFSFGGITANSFRVISTPTPDLKYNGFRYIVRYQCISAQQAPMNVDTSWHTRLIYDRSDMEINELVPSASYKVYVKMVMDGAYYSYKNGCDEAGPFLVHLTPLSTQCNYFQGAQLSCITNNSVTVKVHGPALGFSDMRYMVGIAPVPAQPGDWHFELLSSGSEHIFENLMPGNFYQSKVLLLGGKSGFLYDYICAESYLGTFNTLLSTPPDSDGDQIPDSCDANNQDGPLGDLDGDGILNQDESEGTQESPYPNLPNLSCGVTQNIPPLDSTALLQQANTGDIFLINGFPVLIEQISGGGGIFSGRGVASLPFKQKKLKVAFNNIKVNSNRVVVSGSMHAIQAPANFADLEPDTIAINPERFCRDPHEEGFNANGTMSTTNANVNALGFDEDGHYVASPYGDPNYAGPYDPNFDPNGFDANGFYLNTGSQYNPNGCNQIGLDSLGQNCTDWGPSPYFWLNTGSNLGPVTEEGLAVLETVKDSIKPKVVARLSYLETNLQDSINQQKISCNLFRDTMNYHFGQLNYTPADRIFLYGPNDNWYKEGMYRSFKRVPKKLDADVGRGIHVTGLETAHVNLFHCDRILGHMLLRIEAIKMFGKQPDLGQIVDHLREKIKRFTPEQAQLYGTEANIHIWINAQLDSLITEEFERKIPNNGIGCRSESPQILKEYWGVPNTFQRQKGVEGLWASVDNIADSGSESLYWDGVAFEFNQGMQIAGGIDRAVWLEAIENWASEQLYVSGNGGEAVFSPVKINRDVMGKSYALYLDNIVISPSGGMTDVYIIIRTTPSSDRIIFKALGVKFGPEGFQGPTKMYLGSQISTTLTNAMRLNLKATNNTFVNFDCDGFAGMGIEADIEFCRRYITPLNPTTLVPLPAPENATASIIVNMPVWGAFLAKFTMRPFAVTGHEDFKWRLDTMVMDWNDFQNDPSLTFPVNYQSAFVINQNGNQLISPLWKGFYVKNISVTMPSQWKKGSDPEVTIGAQHLVFDEMGVTGKIFASDLIPLCEGNLGGWAFSLDTIGIFVTANRFAGTQISGKVHIPIFSKDSGCPKEKQTAKYTAALLPGNIYSFSVSPSAEYIVDMWKAQLTLRPDSEIGILYQNGAFIASARLNGQISIDSNGQNLKFKVPDVAFENLYLSNHAPRFSPGNWDIPLTLGAHFGGFELNIRNVSLSKRYPNQDDKCSLGFGVDMRISGDNEGSLAVGCGFKLHGRLFTDSDGRQEWKLDGGVTVDSASINVSGTGFQVRGKLIFFGQDVPHSTFGKGFQGAVFAKFKGIDVEVKAVGIFGKKSDYKYFMVDVLAKFSPGVPVFTGVNLVGAGGGLYWHMNRATAFPAGLPANIGNVDPWTLGIGQNLSGIQYTPDSTKGIGIQLTAVLALTKESAFNMSATFGVSFTAVGGLDRIYFEGYAQFMKELDISLPPVFASTGTPSLSGNSAIAAFAMINYDHQNKVLHGDLRVNINVANGAIVGGGHSELHFAPGVWYINVGTPNQPMSVSLNIPPLQDIASASWYINIGRSIPPFPGLPANVSALTGLGNIVANESARRTGNGFATGMKIHAGTGNINYLIFYANLDLGIGFDLMMQDYGDAVCANLNNEPLGINGWYASGQMWAYVDGNIGIKVRLWGEDKNFNILNIAAAAALQAKFPKPFYARGRVGGRYNLVGGLVKGDCNFRFTIGAECEIAGSSVPNAQEVILELSPQDTFQIVNTLTAPKAIFSIPVYEPLLVVNDAGGEDKYIAVISEAFLFPPDGPLPQTTWDYNPGKTELSLRPANMLQSNKLYTFRIKVEVKKNDVLERTEEKLIQFKTGTAPDYIPSDNIAFAYPVDGMYNFYKNEWSEGKGFMVLKYGQAYLFENLPPNAQKIVRFTRVGALPVEVPFTYNNASKKIEYDIPQNSLTKGKVYKVEFIIKYNSGNIPTLTQAGLEDDGGSAAPANPQAPLTIYKMMIRVSNYDRFADKVSDLQADINSYNSNYGFYGAFALNEPFDDIELNGTEHQPPFIALSTMLLMHPWFTERQAQLKMVYNFNPTLWLEPCSPQTEYDFIASADRFSLDLYKFGRMISINQGSPAVRLQPVHYGASESNPFANRAQTLNLDFFERLGAGWGYMYGKVQGYAMDRWGTNWTGQNCVYDWPNNKEYCTGGSTFGSSNFWSCAIPNNTALRAVGQSASMPMPSSNTRFNITLVYNVHLGVSHTKISTQKSIEIFKP